MTAVQIPAVVVRPPRSHVAPFVNGRTRPYDWTLDPEMRTDDRRTR